MLFCINLLNFVIYIVYAVESLENSLSLTVERDVDVFKLYSTANKTIFDEELSQKFVIFNSKKDKIIRATFGEFNYPATIMASPRMSVNLHTDRHAFFIRTESNTISVNCLCEFFYEKRQMPFMDVKFCCLVELHLDDKRVTNPSAFCPLNLVPHSSSCFTPLIISDAASLPTTARLTATILKLQSGQCVYSTSPSLLYATSSPVSLSFSNRPVPLWRLSDSDKGQLLLGLPLHSPRAGETVLIPVRIVSQPTDVVSRQQLILLQCVLNDRLSLLSIVPNSAHVSVVNNFSFSNNTHTFLNIRLQMNPGEDRELFSLNVTLIADVSVNSESTNPSMQCCHKRSEAINHQRYECSRARIVSLSLETRSLMIIPALQTSDNVFAIYGSPNVSIPQNSMKVYCIVNYRDRSVSDVSQQVVISALDPDRVKFGGIRMNKSDVELKYQDYINPWSIQLSIYESTYTILSPIKVWRADSWRLVLSDDVLRPIKDWVVPGSTIDRKNCVSTFKVARLKILCRLYLLDESGIRQYVGSDSYPGRDPPFIDVTNLTQSSQLRVIPPSVITLEKSSDNSHFSVSTNRIKDASSIELLSLESSQVIASTRISIEADLRSLYVIDLIVHCVDSLSLHRQNRTADTIKGPREYESVTASLSMSSRSLPCYLLVFLVFSDNSTERVSNFDHTHYQMFLIAFEARPFSKTLITDGQLVTIKWTKQTNISVFENSDCKESKLIFSKKMSWGEVEPQSRSNGVTIIPLHNIVMVTGNQTDRNLKDSNEESTVLKTAVFVLFSIIACCIICLILYKIICCKPRSHIQSTTPTCYNISDSGYIVDQHKIQIKTFSANCIRQNHSKTLSKEPYPPLLPPPGPISTNYDLAISDQVCCDSAFDSGIEIGKLSSYSSNTNPSNDLCCSIEQHMSTSMGEDRLARQQSQFSNPLFGYYTHKDVMECIHPYHDSDPSKTIGHIRPPHW